jgi:hypothetical protein
MQQTSALSLDRCLLLGRWPPPQGAMLSVPAATQRHAAHWHAPSAPLLTFRPTAAAATTKRRAPLRVRPVGAALRMQRRPRPAAVLEAAVLVLRRRQHAMAGRQHGRRHGRHAVRHGMHGRRGLDIRHHRRRQRWLLCAWRQPRWQRRELVVAATQRRKLVVVALRTAMREVSIPVPTAVLIVRVALVVGVRGEPTRVGKIGMQGLGEALRTGVEGLWAVLPQTRRSYLY